MATKIMSCECKHEWQDEKYGKGQRVYNKSKGGWRCTVCNRLVLDSSRIEVGSG